MVFLGGGDGACLTRTGFEYLNPVPWFWLQGGIYVERKNMEYEEMTELIVGIVSAVGAVGGWELIKYLLNIKTNMRKEEAEADSLEFGVLKDTVSFLQEQLHEQVQQDAEKEKRFVEQTLRLRKVQDDNYELLKEKSKLELELQMYRCVVKKCPNREPQNGY